MKRIYLLIMLMAPCGPVFAEKNFIFTGSLEELVEECIDDGDDIDFDVLLSPEYDIDTNEIKPRQKNPIDYIPPIIRTIGFAIFTRYIALHNAIKENILSCKRYIIAKYFAARRAIRGSSRR